MNGIILLVVMAVGAASQPTTRTAATQPTVEQQLRTIINGLQRQLAALKEENVDLKQQLDKAKQDAQVAQAAAQRKPASTSPDIADQIVNGMAKADVVDIMGRSADSEIASNGGIEQLTWKFKRPRTPKENGRVYRGAQVDPRNIDLSPSNTEDPGEAVVPSGEVVVFLRGGKVAEVRKSKF
jgi:hypothetical protein